MLKEFQKAARWLGRSQDPFINFAFVFDVGIEEEGLDPGVESADSEMYVFSSYVHFKADICMCAFRSGYEFYLHLYALLKSRIAGFSQHMAPFKNYQDKLNPLTQEVGMPLQPVLKFTKYILLKMLKAMGSARSDDCSSLRDTGLSYIAMDLPARRLEPYIPPHADKGSHRGFQHQDLARLLCPMRMLAEFDADPAEYFF